MNTIIRTCLRKLNLVMMRRDYFDPEAAVNIEVSKGLKCAILSLINVYLLLATPLKCMAWLCDNNPSVRWGILDER